MDPNQVQELHNMQARILQLESELAQARLSDDRIAEIEKKLLGMNSLGSKKILVNKPEVFKGDTSQSLDAFIGHMELYLTQVPQEQMLNVAVSFLGEHAFDWFKVTQVVDGINTWEALKTKLKERFEPVNKVKSARDKLAVWKQVGSVTQFNESFLKIIIDIPNISTDEVIDRYRRGLKAYISTELCTRTYESLTQVMADSLSVESAKKSFKKFQPYSGESINQDPVPMEISNTQLEFNKQKDLDRKNGACFYCHTKGCFIATCPKRKNTESNPASGKDISQ